MASKAASRLLMPPGGLRSAGRKHVVGAGQGPLARIFKIREHEKSMSDLTMKYEKAISELETKQDKALSEVKKGFDHEIIVLRYDLKKEADERSLKHYLDMTNIKNEMKALETRTDARLITQELKTELQFSKDEAKKLKSYVWLFGVATAFLSRFSKLPDVIFKSPNGDQ